jgi:uncharacterized protein (DUF1697 family)
MKYVALLRGINVGGNSKVEMKKLKEIFTALGFDEVSTYINSGNILFSTNTSRNTIVTQIEKTIHKEIGLPIRVVIRDQKQIEEIAESVPHSWTNDAAQKTDVLFLWDEVNSPKILKEIVTNPDVDHLTYKDGAVIWHINRALYNKSKMHKFIGTSVYKQMTARNINTVRKLRDLLAATNK